jgi:hypothetical protein
MRLAAVLDALLDDGGLDEHAEGGPKIAPGSELDSEKDTHHTMRFPSHFHLQKILTVKRSMDNYDLDPQNPAH